MVCQIVGMSTELVSSERISEQVDQTVLGVGDENDWVIRNAVVLNRDSRNGRRYTDSALKDVAKLCERNPVAIEHEDDKGRRYKDRNGQLAHGRVDGQRVVADWHLNENHPTSKQIRTDARKFPENLCLSIEIDEGKWDGRMAGDGVMEIGRVKEMLDTSIVARGGTTKSIYESDPSNKKRSRKMITESKSVDVASQVESKIREADERRKVEDKIDKLTRTLEDQQAVNKKLQESLDEYKLKEERAEKAKLIQERAKTLKAGDISPEYATTLAKLSDTEVEMYLKDRAKLLENAPPASGSTFVETPSIGNQKQETTHELSWMKLCS